MKPSKPGFPSVATHPWTVYLLSDACVDYIRAFEHEADMRAADARLVEAELSAAEATADTPEAEPSRYNLVLSREIEFFLEHYPDQLSRLQEGLLRETLTLNPMVKRISPSASACAATPEALTLWMPCALDGRRTTSSGPSPCRER